MAVLTAILTPNPAALPGYEGIVRATVTHLLPPSQQGRVLLRTSAARGLLLSALGRSENDLDASWNLVSGRAPITGPSAKPSTPDVACPQGGFAMIRARDNGIEAQSDHCGSKTIWHARLECGGVVFSTCVEMIVALLRDFQRDDESLGWFLSAGTSGPRRSWDRRIKPVPPNGRLVAALNGATVALKEVTVPHGASRAAARVDAASLSRELGKAMTVETLGDRPWLLALSGGHDSRAILHGTRHLDDVACVTWVDEHLTDAPGSDLVIARQLAAAAGRPHLEKIIRRPRTAEQMDTAMRRFVRYSDGRVDNYLAYVDGMQIWDDLGAHSAAGLLRGDELFGSAYAINPSQILQNMRLMSFHDYARGPLQQSLATRHSHETPPGFRKEPGENAARWRWRLRASYEISTIYAALNSIRSRFVEVTCPLLSQNLVALAGSMSVRQLSDKALFNEVVGQMYPDIPFASCSSILQRSDINAVPVLNTLILDHLESGNARELLGRDCARAAADAVSFVARTAEEPAAYVGTARRKSAVPVWLKQLKRRFDPPPRLDLVTLGMRSYLAELVNEEMRRTASIGAQAGGRAQDLGA